MIRRLGLQLKRATNKLESCPVRRTPHPVRRTGLSEQPVRRTPNAQANAQGLQMAVRRTGTAQGKRTRLCKFVRCLEGPIHLERPILSSGCRNRDPKDVLNSL